MYRLTPRERKGLVSKEHLTEEEAFNLWREYKRLAKFLKEQGHIVYLGIWNEETDVIEKEIRSEECLVENGKVYEIKLLDHIEE